MHPLHAWAISSNEFALSAHLEVADERISDLTSVVRRVKTMLAERFAFSHPTLEVECAVGGCARGLRAVAEPFAAVLSVQGRDDSG